MPDTEPIGFSTLETTEPIGFSPPSVPMTEPIGFSPELPEGIQPLPPEATFEVPEDAKVVERDAKGNPTVYEKNKERYYTPQSTQWEQGFKTSKEYVATGANVMENAMLVAPWVNIQSQLGNVHIPKSEALKIQSLPIDKQIATLKSMGIVPLNPTNPFTTKTLVNDLTRRLEYYPADVVNRYIKIFGDNWEYWITRYGIGDGEVITPERALAIGEYFRQHGGFSPDMAKGTQILTDPDITAIENDIKRSSKTELAKLIELNKFTPNVYETREQFITKKEQALEKQLATLTAAYDKLPDDNYILKSDAANIRITEPGLYTILTTKGYDAYKKAFDEKYTALPGDKYMLTSDLQKLDSASQSIVLSKGLEAYQQAISEDIAKQQANIDLALQRYSYPVLANIQVDYGTGKYYNVSNPEKPVEMSQASLANIPTVLSYDIAKFLRDGGNVTILESAGFSQNNISKAQEYNNLPYVKKTSGEKLAELVEDAGYDSTKLFTYSHGDIPLYKIKGASELYKQAIGTEIVGKSRFPEPNLSLEDFTANFIYARSAGKDMPSEQYNMLVRLAQTEYRRLYGSTATYESSQKAGLKFLSGFVPVVGTAVYWNEMPTPWKAVSVALDATVVLSFLKPSLGSIARVIKGTPKGLNSAIEAALSQTKETRSTLKAIDSKLANAFDELTKSGTNYAEKKYLVGDLEKTLKTTHGEVRPEIERSLAIVQTEIEPAKQQLIQAGKNFAEAQASTQGKTRLFKPDIYKPAYDDPALLKSLRQDFPKDFVRSIDAAVRDAVNPPIKSIAKLEKEISDIEKFIKPAINEKELAAMQGQLADLATKQRQLAMLRTAEARDLTSKLITAREAGNTVKARSIEVELDKVIKKLEVEWGETLSPGGGRLPPPATRSLTLISPSGERLSVGAHKYIGGGMVTSRGAATSPMLASVIARTAGIGSIISVREGEEAVRSIPLEDVPARRIVRVFPHFEVIAPTKPQIMPAVEPEQPVSPPSPMHEPIPEPLKGHPRPRTYPMHEPIPSPYSVGIEIVPALQPMRLPAKELDDLAETYTGTREERLVKEALQNITKQGTSVKQLPSQLSKVGLSLKTSLKLQSQLLNMIKQQTKTQIRPRTQIRTQTLAQIQPQTETKTQPKTQPKTEVKTKIPEPKPPEPHKPKKVPLILLPELEGAYTGEYGIPQGSILWKQGMFWKYIPPPWNQNKPVTLKEPPAGARNTQLARPQETIQMLGKPRAKAPDSVSVDLGIADIFIKRVGDTYTIDYSGKGKETDVGGRILSPTKGMSIPSENLSRIRGFRHRNKSVKPKRKKVRKSSTLGTSDSQIIGMMRI